MTRCNWPGERAGKLWLSRPAGSASRSTHIGAQQHGCVLVSRLHRSLHGRQVHRMPAGFPLPSARLIDREHGRSSRAQGEEGSRLTRRTSRSPEGRTPAPGYAPILIPTTLFGTRCATKARRRDPSKKRTTQRTHHQRSRTDKAKQASYPESVSTPTVRYAAA